MSGLESSSTSKNLLAHIQGLRGLAILLVVAFHMHLPITGGFIGVDVFFVISGYVISRMLIRNYLETGKLSVLDFWRRRLLRLMPAATLVTVTTVILALFLSSPFDQQVTTAWTALGATFSLSNVIIRFSTGYYFSLPAEANPLLHFWSLSVEQQFYFMLPLLAIAGLAMTANSPFRRRMVITGALIVVCMSFVLSSLASSIPGFADSTLGIAFGFYSPFGRLWQFGIGSIIAIPTIESAIENFSRPITAFLAGLGVAGIAAFSFLLSSTEAFPNPLTLLGTLGAALVIAFGRTSKHVNDFASRSGLVFLGRYSYSFYLWHWPLIVFATYLFPTSPPAIWLSVGISFGLAMLTYHLVENRFRGARLSIRRFSILFTPPLVAALGLLVISSLLLVPSFKNGTRTSLYTGQIEQEEDFYEVTTQGSRTCDSTQELSMWLSTEGIETCFYDGNALGPSIVVIGDSHSWAAFPGIREKNRGGGTLLLPVSSGERLGQELLDLSRSATELPTVRYVYLVAYWSNWVFPAEHLSEASRVLRESDIGVFLIEDVPDFPFDAQNCKYQIALVGTNRCTMPLSDFRSSRESSTIALTQVAAREQIDFVETSGIFCDLVECSMTSGNSLLYFDENHLNPSGSRKLFLQLAESNHHVVNSLSAARD